MPLHPTWEDLGLRLTLAVLASAVLGLDRGVRGHAAGFRTTILVGLAAAMAMIEANLLLGVSGKTSVSFSTLDLMRLPSGILTGVGFIGGGVILKRGDVIRGVTTAATLWATTVIGLCFGAGELVLGLIGVAVAFLTLFVLDLVDERIPRQRFARLVIESDRGGEVMKLPQALEPRRFHARFKRQDPGRTPQSAQFGYDVHWTDANDAGSPAALLALASGMFEVVSFELITESER